MLTVGGLSGRRDWGWAPKYVEPMRVMLQLDEPEDFVIATGLPNALEELVDVAFATVGLDWRRHVRINRSLFRPSEIRCGYSAEIAWLRGQPLVGFPAC